MSAPTSQLSKLSLETMVPNTRSRSAATSMGPSSQEPQALSSSDPESDSDFSSEDSGSTPSTVRSPTRMKYRLDNLPEKTKTSVRDAFGDPPKLAMQRCRLVDNTYAFQMTELVTRSVRIRADADGTSHLTCSCQASTSTSTTTEGDEDTVCPHLLWLLDQLLKQTLYSQDHDKLVTMSPSGWAEEMGDPFRTIADHHLNILAPGLHCQIVDPYSTSDRHIDPTRVVESRELLAHLHSTPLDEYRPDLFHNPTLGKKILKKGDLECSVFRMLLDNHHFFQYFVSLSPPTDPVNDPFRKLSQRVDLVLQQLDHHASHAAEEFDNPSPETPTDVAWAAKHLLGSIDLVKSSVFSRDHPLQPLEALSAARTLVHILAQVVSRNRDSHHSGDRADRNLYLRLIGDHDQTFVVDALNMLPEAASQFLHDLEDILDQIANHGAPASYVAKFRSLIQRLRSSSTGSAMKRHRQGQLADRRNKRTKSGSA